MNAMQSHLQQLSRVQIQELQNSFEDLHIPVCGQFEYIFPDTDCHHYLKDLEEIENDEPVLALLH
ncbi:MAG: hypothetical protein AB7P76_05610 [Candidatus Melainabacteria bacterium]